MRKYLQQIFSVKESRNYNAQEIYPGINGAKGLLILMVVITHCLPPSMALYFLYFFHMPLFMSISGFLLKQSAFKNGLYEYLKRVVERLVVPWTIAWFVYLPIVLKGRPITSISIDDVTHPYYHLWYIPGYIMGALVCYCIYKRKIPVWLTLTITATITVLWYVIYRDKTNINKLPLYWLGDKRFYSYVFFFVTGYCVRNKLVSFRGSPMFLLTSVLASLGVIAFCIFTHQNDLIACAPYMIFNISLALFVLLYIAPQKLLQNKILHYINEQSLGIYLYHPLVIYLILYLLNDEQMQYISNFMGIGVGILTITAVLFFVWLTKKSNVAGKYILGYVKK